MPIRSCEDFKQFGEVIEQTFRTVRLKVPRAKVTETCREVLGTYKVTDINVQELPVEEVIRQLFGEQTQANAGAAGKGDKAPSGG